MERNAEMQVSLNHFSGFHLVGTTFDLSYFPFSDLRIHLLCMLSTAHRRNFQMKHVLPGLYDVEP